MSSPNISTVYYNQESFQLNEGNKRYLTQQNGFKGQSNIDSHLRSAIINQDYTNQQFQYRVNQNYQTQVLGTHTKSPVQNFQQSTTLRDTHQVHLKPVQTIQRNNIQMISRPVTVTNQVTNIQPFQRLSTVSQQSIPITPIVQPTIQRRIVEQLRIPKTASVIVPRVRTANTTVITEQPQYLQPIVKYQYQEEPMVQTNARSAWQSYYEPKKVVQYQAPPPVAPEKDGCCSPWIFALLGLLALICLIFGIIFASKANIGFGSPVSNISNAQILNSNSAVTQQSLYSNYTITVQTTVVNTSSTNLNLTSLSSTQSLNSSTSTNNSYVLSSSKIYNTVYQKTNSTTNNNINNTNTVTSSNSNTNINNVTNSLQQNYTSSNNVNNKLILAQGQTVTFSNNNTRYQQTSKVNQPAATTFNDRTSTNTVSSTNLTNINSTKLSTPTTYSTNNFNTLNVNSVPVPNITYAPTAIKQTQNNNLYSPYQINVSPIPVTVNSVNYQNNAYVPSTSTTTFNNQYTVNVEPTVHNPVPITPKTQWVFSTSASKFNNTTNQPNKNSSSLNQTSITSTGTRNQTSYVTNTANSSTLANISQTNSNLSKTNQAKLSQTGQSSSGSQNISTQINKNLIADKTIGILNETKSFIPSTWSFISSNKTQNRIQPNKTSITNTQDIVNQTTNTTAKSTTVSNISLASITNTSKLTQDSSKIQKISTLNNTNQQIAKNQSVVNQNSTITGSLSNSTTNNIQLTKILPINQTIIPTTTPASTEIKTTYTPPSQPIFGQINAFSAIRTLTNQKTTQRHQLRINNLKLI